MRFLVCTLLALLAASRGEGRAESGEERALRHASPLSALPSPLSLSPGGGFEGSELAVAGDALLVTRIDHSSDQKRVACYDLRTGACKGCNP